MSAAGKGAAAAAVVAAEGGVNRLRLRAFTPILPSDSGCSCVILSSA